MFFIQYLANSCQFHDIRLRIGKKCNQELDHTMFRLDLVYGQNDHTASPISARIKAINEPGFSIYHNTISQNGRGGDYCYVSDILTRANPFYMFYSFHFYDI